MSDIVKIIFDGDLGPLEAKQAIAKGELSTFVAESEAEIKGITSVGDVIGSSAQKGAASFSQYYKPVINDVSRDIKALGTGFERVLGPEAAKGAVAGLEDLGFRLKKLNVDGYEAAASSAVLDVELKAINKDLQAYQFELATASKENIFFTETQVAAAEAGKLNLGARPLQGYGGLFRATGLTNAGVNETEANAALNIASKLGLTFEGIAGAVGVGATAALATAIITTNIRKDAEARLSVEIATSVEYGRQQKLIFDMKQAMVDLTTLRNNNSQDDAFTKGLKGQSLEQLESQRDSAVKNVEGILSSQHLSQIYNDPTPQQKTANENEFNQAKKQLLELDAAIQKAKDSRTALFNRDESIGDKQRLDKASSDAAQDFRDQIQAAKSNVVELKKILAEASSDPALTGHDRSSLLSGLRNQITENIKAAQAEVERLTKSYKDEFDKLFMGANQDNPFARQTIESSKALETLEEKLKGVGPELRKQALDLQVAASAQQVYTLQINSAFQSIDLHAQAGRFSNPTQKELKGRLDERYQEFLRTSNSTNPDVFNDFQREQKRIDDFDRDKKQDILDQKLDVAGKAKTDSEIAIADKAVTAFAGGLNPDDLTRGERSKIAEAFERSAVRNETRQEEALDIQRKLLETMKAIDKRGSTLSGIAGEGGKTKLDITLKDDTSDKKATAATATTDDVAKVYDLGFSGGTNK